MEGKLFYEGQEITPNTDQGDFKPMFGKVFTVSGYFCTPAFPGVWFIELIEIPPSPTRHFFDQNAFSPLIPSEDIEELIEESLLQHGVI
jgi:hypothetical protein